LCVLEKHELKLITTIEELENKKPIFNTQEPNLDREDVNKYGFQDFAFVRVESSHGRGYANPFPEFLEKGYQGYYIHGYNTEQGKPETKVIPITKEQAKEIWQKEIDRHPNYIGGGHEVEHQQKIYRLKDEIRYYNPEQLAKSIIETQKNIDEYKQKLKDTKPEQWESEGVGQYKANVDLLRKLSPSTWCTAGGMADHYVENYDNYLLIVNGITVAGIEATDEENDNGKIQVKEVTSRGNNGVASVDHIEDIVAFFEKHDLDTDNYSLQSAIRAKEAGKTDQQIFREEDNEAAIQMHEMWDERDAAERWAIDEHNGEHEYDPPEYDEQYAQMEADRLIVANINTIDEALASIELVVDNFEVLNSELRDNEELATKAVELAPHNITHISPTVPFYNRLATEAVTKNP